MNSIYQADATYPCNTIAKRVSTELFLFSLFVYTTNTMIKKNTCRNSEDGDQVNRTDWHIVLTSIHHIS